MYNNAQLSSTLIMAAVFDNVDASPLQVDSFFNDLSQPTSRRISEPDAADSVDGQPPKAKRIACVLCRKRKLRCDGTKPACGTCKRLSHDCSYDEVRKKSGPKRGYVKALEARLAQVETMLKQDGSSKDDQPQDVGQTSTTLNGACDDLDLGDDNLWRDIPHDSQAFSAVPNACKNRNELPPIATHQAGDVMFLGLEEAMPNPDVIAELTQLYFDRVHPSMPMMHRPRFLASLNLAPNARPPVCLRYAMWAHAALSVDKYDGLHEHFYQRARKYAERDEMRGHGENMVTVAHTQTWFLISAYEFKMTYFPRAWMSTGRATRLAQMLGMHRMDGQGLDVKQCLPSPRDWIEREERRRTFWMVFCEDRYASIGTGWPMTIDEQDILSHLPVDEESFELGIEKPSIRLTEAFEPEGASKLSSFGGVVVMSCLFGRNLTHLHRPTPGDEEDESLNGNFWRRHRTLDNILLNIALSLPDHLRLPAGLEDSNIVFMNMCVHTSTICLHQAAIFKADGAKMAASVSAESKIRCIAAAGEIASIMRMISHKNMNLANPFTSFCLYVAARVFVQYLKSRPNDFQVKSSLHFLLNAMNVLKRRNPLTESFLVQLDVDLQGAGLEEFRSLRTRLAKMNIPKPAPDKFSQYAPGSNNAVPGGVPHSASFIDTLEPQWKKPPTYGDNGLSQHTSPNAISMDVGVCGTELGSIPSRQKTCSVDPGPGSEEVMDVTADSLELSSTESGQNYSMNGSSTAFTPPSLGQDGNNQMNWDTSISHDRRAVYLGDSQPIAQDSFDRIIFEYADMNFDQNMVEHNANLNMEFTISGTGLTPGNFSGGGTGLTPGASGDLLNMSDEEWKRLMGGVSTGGGGMEMGWNSNDTAAGF